MKSPTLLLKESFAFYKTHFLRLAGIAFVPVFFDILAAFSPFEVLMTLCSFVASIFAYIALIIAIDAPNTSCKDAFTKAKSFFFSYLFASILCSILVTIGFLALLLPGLLFVVWFAVVSFVVVLEGKGPIAALKQSREYARDKWSPIFARLVVIAAVAIACIVPFAILFSGLGFEELLLTVCIALITPFAYTYMYLLYKEMKSV